MSSAVICSTFPVFSDFQMMVSFVSFNFPGAYDELKERNQIFARAKSRIVFVVAKYREIDDFEVKLDSPRNHDAPKK
jgi:hypothetical protein